MIELDIPTLTEIVTLCFANSRNNQAFNLEQRRTWLIQGIEQRQRLRQLIGEKIADEASPLVQEANQRLSEINQRLKDVQETLRKFNNTIEQITALVDILDQIIGLVSTIVPLHSTIKNPPVALARELEPVTPTPTAGHLGTAPNQPFYSSDKLLVKGKGSVTELTTRPTELVGIVPPYAPVLPESIYGGVDDRERILDTHNAPWRMICSLSIAGPNGNFLGTGWFAGPKTIITAAHCIYEEVRMRGWASQIQVFPGRDGHTLPYQAVSQQFEVPEEWVESGGTNPDYDYGAIHLDTPLGEEIGWFSVAVASNDELNGVRVNLSGYPNDAKGGWGKYQLFHADQISSVAENRFFYTIDTFGGQSGAPVWFELDNGKRQVVGIHTYGIRGSFRLNSATRITPIILNDVKKWLEND